MGRAGKNEFLLSLRSETEVKNRKLAENSQRRKKKRNVSIHWHLPVRGSERVKVCKKAICDIFCVSFERLDKLPDQANKNESRGRPKGTSPKKEAVKKFLSKIPTHKSHYNRKRCPHRFYVAIDGINTFKDLFDVFKADPEFQDIKMDERYFRMMVKYYNVGFKKNRTDECDFCTKIQTKNLKNSKVFKRHILRAKEARNEFRRDVSNKSNTVFVGERDLKSVTNLPKVTIGSDFYLRKHSLYTSIIKDSRTGESYLFHWTEAEAGRGTSEMITCRLKFIEEHCDANCDVIFFEDNCMGQNKSG